MQLFKLLKASLLNTSQIIPDHYSFPKLYEGYHYPYDPIELAV